jgi:toxin-antitoxin system PIN domain toxin
VALLDTNVLLALAWPTHQHHAIAQSWFSKRSRHGWATCAFTQLGFIRLSSNPAYSPDAVSPREAAQLLQQWAGQTSHRFWDSPPAVEERIYANALGHQQVNDAWLIEAAKVNKGRLVTLDSRLTAHLRSQTEKNLVEVIGVE